MRICFLVPVKRSQGEPSRVSSSEVASHSECNHKERIYRSLNLIYLLA